MSVPGGVTYRVFNIRKNAVSKFRTQQSKPEWRIAPPVDHGHRTDNVTIEVIEPGSYKVEVYSDVFTPSHASGTNSVTVTIRTDIDNGQYPFEVYVDDQFVNANSAPGIIVD